MNPFVISLLSAVVRWALTFAAAHEIAVSEDQTTQIVSGAVAIASLVWSFIHKSRVDAKITNARGY